MDVDEFSPEQLAAIALMRNAGVVDPEEVARSSRVATYRLGVHFLAWSAAESAYRSEEDQ